MMMNDYDNKHNDNINSNYINNNESVMMIKNNNNKKNKKKNDSNTKNKRNKTTKKNRTCRCEIFPLHDELDLPSGVCGQLAASLPLSFSFTAV